MKRTPLVRRKPLRRSKPIKARKPATRHDPHILYGVACEAQIWQVCTGTSEHAHHRRRRSQGGADTRRNLAMLCARCHLWIHDHPAKGHELGFLLRHGDLEWDECGKGAS